MTSRLMLLIAALIVSLNVAYAQDVPGIEICTAEKTMERRTGCLQSNVDFLKTTMTKASLENRQKLDAASRQIDALKLTLVGLQKTVEQLQTQIQALEKKSPPASPPAPAAK